ncbi:MAG: GGDEF domain-containing phosphodiesterase [Steroidobacteraceae bacterium]
MLASTKKYPLLIVDPNGLTNSRAARIALEQLPVPVHYVTDINQARTIVAAAETLAVVLAIDATVKDPAALCALIRNANPDYRPALAMIGSSIERSAAAALGLAGLFTPPFEWPAIAQQLLQLLAMESLKQQRADLDALLELSRIATVTIDAESQSCVVTAPLAALLGLTGSGWNERRDGNQSRHWQKLFANCDEVAREHLASLLTEAFDEGNGFEFECDLTIERNHKRRIRLTGRPTGDDNRRRVDIVAQDITAQTSRNTSDAVNRMLDTTLGLRPRDRVIHALIRAVAGNPQGSVLLVRLNGLADFYRRQGYQVGGSALRKFAETLEDSLSRSEQVFRIDPRKGQALVRVTGGEFVVFVPNLIDDKSLANLISMMLSAAQAALRADERMAPITLKFGISSWPRDGSSPDELLQSAHLASEYFEMSETSQNSHGANSVMGAVVRSREQARLESELHNAIERDQLQLHYQPKLNLSDGRIVGFEALLRWRRGNKAYVPPAIFIPIAERTGLITELGRWVIERAVKQMAEWRAAGLGTIPVAVNVSPQQFASDEVVTIIRDACAAQLIEPNFLQIEVTESSLIDDAESAIELLHAIKKLGCSIALDDFGTGFSSLSYLRQLPLDVLKIDRSFTTTIEAEQQRPSLITSIIDIAKSLNLKIVAEGVAAPTHWDMLAKWGCDEAQGFLISQPVPAAEVPNSWSRGRWDAQTYSFVIAPESAAAAPYSNAKSDSIFLLN